MERAAVPSSTSAAVVFRDGLGERRHVVDPAGNETLELLCLRGDLAAVPSFEFALRERVSRLANFRHAYFGRVRSIERLADRDAALAVVSDRTPGVRLSQMLVNAEERRLGLDINTALCLIRQLVPAVAMLHESAREVAHGAIGPERLVVTPNARLIIVEYVMGAALEQLRFSHDRYWNELRAPLPRTSGPARFDQRADVTQVGVVALSLILGRLLRDEEYPSRIADVLASTWAVSARGGFEPLPPGLRGWLGRALQLDPRNAFASAIEARDELDKVLGDSDYMASPASLESFLARYQAAAPATPGSPPVRAATTPRLAPPIAEAPARPAPSIPASPRPAPIVAKAPTAAPPAAHGRDVVSPSRAFDTPGAAPSPNRSPAAANPRSPEPTPTYVPPRPSLPHPASAVEVQPIGDSMSVRTPARGTSVPPNAGEGPLSRTPARGTAVPAQLNEASLSRTPARGTAIPPHISEAALSRTPARGTPATRLATPSPTSEPPAPDLFIAEQAPPQRWPKVVAVAAVLALVVGAGAFAARMYLAGASAVASTGTLVITTNPSGAAASVDGESRGVTPLTLSLPPGAHTVVLKAGGAQRSIPVTIAAGAQVSQYIELPQATSSLGQLQVRTEPPGAKVTVDGVPVGTSPMMVIDLAPGEHTVALESDLGSLKQAVKIESGMTASLVVPLGAAEGGTASGWIAVSAPVEVQLYERDRLLGTSRSDRIMLPTGRHEIDLVNESLGYRATRIVQVTPGKVAPIPVDLPKGTIALNALPWAEVWIDGERAGETPIGNLPIGIGSHDIVFRHPELGEQHHTVMVTLKNVTRLSVDFRKP